MDDQKSLSSSMDDQQTLPSSVEEQQAFSQSGDAQQIFYSSLDDQQEHVFQQYDESWFDLADPCGREFELPNVSNSMNLDCCDISNNMLISTFQGLDIPSVLDNTFVLESPVSTRNRLAALPTIEMAPSVTNTVSVVDQQRDIYWFGPDICILPNVATPSNASQMGSSSLEPKISISMKSQQVTPTHAPLPNGCGSEVTKHAFGPSSLQVSQTSSYIVPNNGHMSSHTKARKTGRIFPSPKHASENNSIEAGCFLEATDKEIDVNKFSNKAKGKLLITSAGEYAVEKLSFSDELVKEGCYNSHKRAWEGTLPPNNVTENKTTSLCKVQRTETALLIIKKESSEYP
ncbi:hypothetical protein FNV43_RR02957 [Rhamnella rubrinervis]|uniref:Uncharacterized protein n=1 Tax=Rhamnella rubrinervis TaxID=2594499 RepID=A0A8K0MNK9_9ROSA|nr:hypothetical protein FNV43_RR02957 [Rhamnella rubrinervis]